MESCEGKLGQSVSVLSKHLDISAGSVSSGFKKLGLFAYRRSVQSRLRQKHIKERYEVSKLFFCFIQYQTHKVQCHKSWENYLVTDEKVWTVDGYFNPQNDRVRARKNRMSKLLNGTSFQGNEWSGSGRVPGYHFLVHFNGNVNGKTYQEKVLKKVVLENVLVKL